VSLVCAHSNSRPLCGPSLQGGRISPTGAVDISELKFKFHPLPVSPFVAAGSSRGSYGSDNALDDATGGRSSALVRSSATTPHVGGISPKPRLAELAVTARSTEEDSTLDAFRLHESQRLSMENGDGLDLHAFRMSMDSNPSARHVSITGAFLVICLRAKHCLLPLYLHSQARSAAATARTRSCTSTRICPSHGPTRRVEPARRRRPALPRTRWGLRCCTA
jgi:hypothetical protein